MKQLAEFEAEDLAPTWSEDISGEGEFFMMTLATVASSPMVNMFIECEFERGAAVTTEEDEDADRLTSNAGCIKTGRNLTLEIVNKTGVGEGGGL